jgi:Ni/Co efflux regulator RcnB
MKRFSSRLLAVVAVGCVLITGALSASAQSRDRDRNSSDTRAYQQNDRNHDRSRHNGRTSGQYNRNYRGNGSYRRSSSAPFAYIGAADQRRNGYVYGNTRRHHRHHRHH